MGKDIRQVGSGHTYFAVLGIPADVRRSFGGKSQLTKTTGTTDYKQAKRIAARMTAQWRDQFDAARTGQPTLLETELGTALRLAIDANVFLLSSAHVLGQVAAHEEIHRQEQFRERVTQEVLATVIRNLPHLRVEDFNNPPRLTEKLMARPPSETPFDAHLKEFLATQTKLGTKARNDATTAIPRFAGIVKEPLETLDSSHIVKWVEAMREIQVPNKDDPTTTHGLLAPTIRRHRSLLRTYWLWMVKRKYVSGDPFYGVAIDETRTSEELDAAARQHFKPEQIETVLAACKEKDIWLYRLVVLGMETGARRESLVRLRKKQMNRNGEIRYLRLADKTDAGRRDVVITKIAAEVIDEMVAEARDGWLFPAHVRSANAVNEGDRLGKIFSRLKSKKLKFDHTLTFHSLRHTRANQIAESGADPFLLMDMMGWTDVKTAKRYMKNASIKRMAEMVEKVAKPAAET